MVTTPLPILVGRREGKKRAEPNTGVTLIYELSQTPATENEGFSDQRDITRSIIKCLRQLLDGGLCFDLPPRGDIHNRDCGLDTHTRLKRR